MPAAFTIEPARPQDQAAAFELVFQHLDEAERELRVSNALTLLGAGDLEPEGIFVIRQGVKLAGALVCVPLRGASGLLWPPFVRSGAERALQEDQLVRSALSWLRGRGAKLAQAVLGSAEVRLAAPLERSGFRHITRLDYLRHRLESVEWPKTPASFSCQTYPHSDPQLFQQTLLRTYEGTQDCPELNGVRTMDEILDGHRAQGVFDPNRWRLAWDGAAPVGVLLATEVVEWQGWDISYVGVVPEARRRGIGRWLTQLVLGDAKAAGASQVTLAVDARNRPAWNLYVHLGFELWDQREAYLFFFPPMSR
jgi:ribosomal protein S18 acetylase RimI-like enzyme